jgi:hypothetical protein
MIWIETNEHISDEDIEKYHLTVFKNGVMLDAENEKEVKAFLYSKFGGSKELILKEDDKELDRLKLNELFNEK